MIISNNIDVEIKLGANAPEIAICWYVGQMLSIPKFLKVFLEREHFYFREMELEKIEIIREHQIENKRIDLCVFLTDIKKNTSAIIIEAKVHWPRSEQLNDSIEIVKKTNSGCSNLFGIQLITTNDRKQLDCLYDEIQQKKFHHPVVTIESLLKLFCETAIKEGFSLRPASDLQQLFDCRLQRSSFVAKATN